MKRINFWTILEPLLAGVIILVLINIYYGESFSPAIMMVEAFAGGLAIIGTTLYYRRQFKEHEGIIFEVESLPIGKTDGVVEGVPFAGTGTVVAENGALLLSPYAKMPCLYYHSVKEKQERQGKNSHWVIVENIARSVPFHLEDERGAVNINLTNIDDDFSGFMINPRNGKIPDPRHSEIDCVKVLDGASYGDANVFSFFGISKAGKYRLTELILMPKTKVFVCGMGSKLADGQLALREDPRCPLIITTKNRNKFVKEFYQGSNLLFLSYVIIAFGFSLSLWAANYFLKLQEFYFLSIMYLANFVILSGMLFSIYNRIVSRRNRALGALSNIEVELNRRADLIPNLVAVVESYSHHEQNIQEFTAQARAHIFFSKNAPQDAASPLFAALAAVAEKYPQLKASDNFQELARELADTEGRIAYSREFYNRNARKYNTYIQQFPSVAVAWMFGFKEMEFVSIA